MLIRMKRAAATSIFGYLTGGIFTLGSICMVVSGSLLVYSGNSLLEKLPPFLNIVVGSLIFRQGIQYIRFGFTPNSNYSVTNGGASPSVEDRLDELERLKRRDMVTPEEYAAKRQEILKDL